MEWNHGWCNVYLALVYARLAEGNKAYEVIKPNLDKYLNPSGLQTNAPYIRGEGDGCTLEPSLATSALILDMLLQSWGGTLRLFPAIPDSWQNASFCHLRAEGAFLVSARLQDGQVSFVHIKSNVGGPCSLMNPYQGRIAIYNEETDQKIAVPQNRDMIEFNTEAGSSYLILPATTIVDNKLSLQQMYLPERPPDQKNVFGRHTN